MTKITYKRMQLLLTFISFSVLASSFYFEYIKGLQPCPLCIMQRICVFLLFMICFIASVIRSLKAGIWIASLQFFVAAGGLFFAGRQLWLQSLPPGQAPACMPDLDIMFRYFPWRDVLNSLFWGTGDCAEATWQAFGLSMPTWAALYFLAMLIIAVPIFFLLRNQLAKFQQR